MRRFPWFAGGMPLGAILVSKSQRSAKALPKADLPSDRRILRGSRIPIRIEPTPISEQPLRATEYWRWASPSTIFQIDSRELTLRPRIDNRPSRILEEVETLRDSVVLVWAGDNRRN